MDDKKQIIHAPEINYESINEIAEELNKNWIYTGDTENGMKIWVKQELVNNVETLKYEYRNDTNDVLFSCDMPLSQINSINEIANQIGNKINLENIDISYIINQIKEIYPELSKKEVIKYIEKSLSEKPIQDTIVKFICYDRESNALE